MTRRTPIAITLGLGVSACAAPGTVAPPVSRPVVSYTSAGLERVIGQDAAGLVRLFGQPDADVREGPARKLQFAGPICVLDAYLYPKDNEAPASPISTRANPTAAPSTARAASPR